MVIFPFLLLKILINWSSSFDNNFFYFLFVIFFPHSFLVTIIFLWAFLLLSFVIIFYWGRAFFFLFVWFLFPFFFIFRRGIWGIWHTSRQRLSSFFFHWFWRRGRFRRWSFLSFHSLIWFGNFFIFLICLSTFEFFLALPSSHWGNSFFFLLLFFLSSLPPSPHNSNIINCQRFEQKSWRKCI